MFKVQGFNTISISLRSSHDSQTPPGRTEGIDALPRVQVDVDMKTPLTTSENLWSLVLERAWAGYWSKEPVDRTKYSRCQGGSDCECASRRKILHTLSDSTISIDKR